jgi:hypothetical protein
MSRHKRRSDAHDNPDSALSRAAEQGPLPGINDEAQEEPEATEKAGHKQLSPEDEIQEIVGFRGLR